MKHLWPIYLATTFLMVYVINQNNDARVGVSEIAGEVSVYLIIGLIGAVILSIKKKWNVVKWLNAITLGGLIVSGLVLAAQAALVKKIVDESGDVSINYSENDLLNLAKSNVSEYVSVLAAGMVKSLPMETGFGKLISVTAVDNKMLTITELENNQRPKTKQEQLNYVCSASYLKEIVVNGGIYAVQYVDKNRSVLGYLEVAYGECK